MCTRYITPEQADVERIWEVSGRRPMTWAHDMFPNYQGPFIRAAKDGSGPELVVGQWSLIPWFAKERKLKFATCNARFEELAQKASYKQPWARGQRCIIPAAAFFEPCWETGKHVPWLFRRTDGTPWALAGLWNTWTDPVTGEVVESYTMITLNADEHPLMRRMHKPDPKLSPDEQDKRSVVPLEGADWNAWLKGTMEDAKALVKLARVEDFDAAGFQQALPPVRADGTKRIEKSG